MESVTPPEITNADAESKRIAAQIVVAYRALNWEAIDAGDQEAVAQLVLVCEQHDQANQWLEVEGGELGARLRAGLDRFHETDVLPHLSNPRVLWHVARAASEAAKATASVEPSAVNEEADDSGLSPRDRPNVTIGQTVRMNTGCGNLYVTVNEDEHGHPFELFNHMGKAGGCAASQNEAIGRLISYALRCGAQLEPLLKQLKGISCHRPAWGEEGKISSCSDAIGKALEKYRAAREVRLAQQPSPSAEMPSDGSTATTDRMIDAKREVRAAVAQAASERIKPSADAVHQGACMECGSQLSYEEGCVKCHSCGFTECG